MISMRTMEELHIHNHTLALYCLSCNRWGEANLERLIQNGKGHKPVTEARFRCRDCGEIVEKQVRPPVPSLGEAVTYI
jgi:RNase P subunit RPR2